MLQLKNIRKKYVTGGYEQIALDGVSLNLRDNEFVAILGPSGSGKTTMLNIIGGLDRYDSGDLVIDGISTRKYKDRDWDSYRNHTVGFVFQSYNLIPHQSVLQNVELALTIGGISSARRRQMALDALEKVGLKEQAHKKPGQMSGGQMQRVAIARALVNDPKILLADEPTGALDTKTSVQVMELLKEVAADRLVVMVTHNPDLADEYANRIVRLQDGSIISDTNPLVIEEELPSIHKNLGKASMSLLTSFGLSLNNLMTKKGRTILTSFAGSIGIIGIALILALSTGFQNYIDQVQEETMNSYPLTISSEAGDFTSMILSMQAGKDIVPEGDQVVEQQFISAITNSLTTNDLRSFIDYLDAHPEEYADDVQMIKYNYAVTPLIYTIDAADNMAKLNPSEMSNYSAGSVSFLSNLGSGSSMSSFSEITNLENIKEDYTLLAGTWPERYNEMLIALSSPNQISDFLLYSLGLRDTKELNDLMKSYYLGEKATIENDPMVLTYSDLLNLDLRLVDPSDLYRYNREYDIYEDMSDDEDYMMEVYENSEKLHIVGVIYSPERNNGASAVGVLYLSDLPRYVMNTAAKSEIVQKQLASKDIDVFSGKEFDSENDEDGLDFQDMISVDEDMLAEAFVFNGDFGALNFDQSGMADIVTSSSQAVVENIDQMTGTMVSALTQADSAFATGIIEGYKQIATVTVNNSTAPEAAPDVSAVTGLLSQQLEQAKEEARNQAYPVVSDTVTASISNVKSALESASTKEEAESIIDALNMLGMDSEMAAQLKATIKEGSSETDPVPGEGEGSGTGETGETGDSGETGEGETGSGSSKPDVSETLAMLDQIQEQLINAGVDAAVNAAVQPVQSLIDSLNSASTKAEADAIIDSMGLDETQASMMKSLIVKQFEEGGESTSEQYLTLAYLDMYKEQAINEETIAQMTSGMEGIELDPAHTAKIVGDAFDNYYGSLTPDENGMVPLSDLPPVEDAVNQSMTDNSALLFQDGYELAKNYMVYLVMQGTAQALGEAMAPLGALADLFGGEDLLTIDTDKFAEAFQFEKDEDELNRLMSTLLSGNKASYTSNLLGLGYQDDREPSSISFYFRDFESKNNFMDFLERYNENADEEQELTYTDLTGILMGSVETIINAVTYVLIAFVSISLIVSSIMIGIITYISVLERTKEIGILRAIGASKRNISSIFNAETFIIGLLSGVIGVLVTRLLLFPINDVIHRVTDIDDITAVLDPVPALVLVIIATVLTMIGGLIPSSSASKKDPVIALRTE